MTQTTRSTTNILLLVSSFLVGVFAVAMCLLARTFFMKTPPDWLTIDYTVAGWWLRIIAAMVGIGSLFLALLARCGIQKRPLRGLVYRADVAIALIAIAFEIAIPAILLIVIITLLGDAVSRNVESQSLGCLGVGLDLFNWFDDDD